METYRSVVYNWECDMFDHMNVQYYQAKFDAASWYFIAQVGMPSTYFRSENRGLVAMEQHIRYHRELLPGDLVVIQSELLKIGQKSIKFKNRMFNALTGDLSAEAEYISLHINTKTRKSVEFPAEVRASLELALKDSGKKS